MGSLIEQRFMGLTCKICFENASSSQGMHARITPCGHVFCHPCATTWFRSDAACPVCRRTVEGLSSLIPLYDQDAGLQSSSLELCEDSAQILVDGIANGGSHGGEKHYRDFQLGGRMLQHGGLEHGSPADAAKSVESKGIEEREFDFLHRRSGEDEEVHVRYVLDKVAERWQQVMVERAKLKVQVARLDKTKQELLLQLQRMGEENMALRQALGERSRSATRGSVMEQGALEELEKECELWESSFMLDRDSEVSSATRVRRSEICCAGAEMGTSQGKVSLVKPPVKVLERLGAKKWELAHTFAMHSSAVHGIAVNSTGNLVATASWDHLCKVYDVHLEEEVAVLFGHELGLYAVKFSPSKRNVIGTVSSDHTCRLWNVETAECLRVLEGHMDEVNGLAFKNGTHLLATASDDMTCKIWDAEKGLCVTTLKGHRQCVYGVCFQPQGHLLATSSFDLTAKLWDPRSAENVRTLRGHLEDVIGVDIDSSGSLLATGSDDKTCRVWDLCMGNCLEVLAEHCGEVKRVAFAPFSRLLATTSGDTTARLYDTCTFECLHVLSSHSDHVFDVAWSPMADFLVTASHDQHWKLWQPRAAPFGYSLISSNFR
eukprot:c27248_g1_i1 orf=166-1974(+)